MHGDGEGLIGSADLPMIPLVAKSMPMPSSADVTPRERVMGVGGQTLEMHGDGEGLIGSADLPMIPLVAKSMPMPSSADVTPRERVMGLFDQGLRKKMTFVCADEGFGKSTALADWHRRRLDSGALSVWFTADRHDRDPERFWMNFVYAVTAALGEEAFAESKDAWSRTGIGGV